MVFGFKDAVDLQARALTLSERQLDRVSVTLRDIADWLRHPATELGQYSPRVYVQGSVCLRTSITPKKGGGYDADLICELDPEDRWIASPRTTFEAVGEHLGGLPGFRGCLQQKKRCWALVYDPGYHVDITPAVRDASGDGASVLVFDTNLNNWKSSTPASYSKWFCSKAAVFRGLPAVGASLRVGAGASDPLSDPGWKTAYADVTPLARAVQLLKRRRDLWFDTSQELNSMVLTTVAARSYAGEDSASQALLTIVDRIANEFRGGASNGCRVVNPVNPHEVLSENWTTNKNAIGSFKEFIEDTRARLSEAARAASEDKRTTKLHELFGLGSGVAAESGKR